MYPGPYTAQDGQHGALDRGLPTAQEVSVCVRVFCASVCEQNKDYVKLLRDP